MGLAFLATLEMTVLCPTIDSSFAFLFQSVGIMLLKVNIILSQPNAVESTQNFKSEDTSLSTGCISASCAIVDQSLLVSEPQYPSL